MLQNLSPAAVVIGTLRYNLVIIHKCSHSHISHYCVRSNRLSLEHRLPMWLIGHFHPHNPSHRRSGTPDQYI